MQLQQPAPAANQENPETNAPPPLPPRPGQSASSQVVSPYGYGGLNNMTGLNSFSPYGNSLSSFGYGGGGGYGSGYGMGGYGGYGGYGMSRYGMGYGGNPGDSNSDFLRLAEESSRPAFQSIESIVHAFGSVAMMLESTYFAVHSSFRAVLGVAEHFSRMNGQISQTSLSVIRTLSLFLRRLAYLIGLSHTNPNDETNWRESMPTPKDFPLTPEGVLDALTRADDGSRGKSSWPILIFFAVVCGTPWLIWKLLSKMTGSRQITGNWMSGETEHYLATGMYDFAATSPNEVSFKAGQKILIAPRDSQPKVRGWLLATVDGQRAGLVPAPYLKVIGIKSSPTSPILPPEHSQPQPEEAAPVAESSEQEPRENTCG